MAGVADSAARNPAAIGVNVASGGTLCSREAPWERSIMPTNGIEEGVRDIGSSNCKVGDR